MHPGHYYPYAAGRYHGGGPSRLLWFFLGGLAATWWIRRKDMHRLDGGGGVFGHCSRHKVQPPAIEAVAKDGREAEAENSGVQWKVKWGGNSEKQSDTGGWDEDKDRMKAIGMQAADTMTEISEATLDSVLSTVETLKAKMAEHRAQREQEQKLFQRQLEEERGRQQSPPRRLV